MNRKEILLRHFVAVFNDQQLDDDEPHLITPDTAESDGHFLYWLHVWSDDPPRAKLYQMLTNQ